MLDQLLEKVGLKYEDLNAVERETLNTWAEALQKGQLGVESIKAYISSMRDGVIAELCKTENGSKQDTFLKARLRNYTLLEGFLSSPEKAKQQIENAISSMIGKKS